MFEVTAKLDGKKRKRIGKKFRTKIAADAFADIVNFKHKDAKAKVAKVKELGVFRSNKYTPSPGDNY